MKEIRSTMPQIGRVTWIGLRPERGAPINVVNEVVANQQGLDGDASILARVSVSPDLLRRNIVVAGINLQALKESEFQIGEATLFATGNCAPCSLMEKNLGPGGYNAMRGHGGITARVISPGKIQVNDEVKKY